MKKLPLLFIAFIFAAQCLAQITLERSDYTLTSDGGTVLGWRLSVDNVTTPEEGPGVIWDFSSVAILSASNYTKNPVSDPQFPDANLVEYSSSLALNLVPQSVNFYETIDDDGYRTIGRTTGALTLPAQQLTGGANDTITFLGTVSHYDQPSVFLEFPLNYQDSWNTDLNIYGDYQMTVQAFGLDHVPASSKYNYVDSTKVVGYGTLMLPHPDGTGSVSMDALLVKSVNYRTDSFFLAGQPAPAIMLSVLNLQQGFVEVTTDYTFYVKGLNRSALSMRSRGGQITGISMADGIRNFLSSTKNNDAALAELSVFPNPTSGDVQLEFEKSDSKTWTFGIYNQLGQMLQIENLEGPIGFTRAGISLSPSAPTGLVHYVLRNAEGRIVANGSLIKR